MSVESKKTIDEYGKVGDEREIYISYKQRKYGSSYKIGKSSVKYSLNGEWSIDEKVFPSDQSDDFNLIAIEEYEISDTVIDDNKYRKYEKSDDTINTVLNGQKNIYKSLDTIVLRPIISQRFLGTLLVVLNNPSITLDDHINSRILPEWDIFDNYR